MQKGQSNLYAGVLMNSDQARPAPMPGPCQVGRGSDLLPDGCSQGHGEARHAAVEGHSQGVRCAAACYAPAGLAECCHRWRCQLISVAGLLFFMLCTVVLQRKAGSSERLARSLSCSGTPLCSIQALGHSKHEVKQSCLQEELTDQASLLCMFTVSSLRSGLIESTRYRF